MLDLVVRGGHVVTPGRVVRADVGVGDGVIAEVAPELDGTRVLDATGLHVFPGGLDPHVHFNEPGRTHWEGIKTGSAALALLCPTALRLTFPPDRS
jgi:allantoinase